MTHHVKITPIHYEEIASGRKNFEIRLNDRDYKVGDIVELQEFLGKERIPMCPDFHCCNKELECVLGRIYCNAYSKEIYSGKSICIKIIDMFDISDIIPKYVAFTFEIINIKEQK